MVTHQKRMFQYATGHVNWLINSEAGLINFIDSFGCIVTATYCFGYFDHVTNLENYDPTILPNYCLV